MLEVFLLGKGIIFDSDVWYLLVIVCIWGEWYVILILSFWVKWLLLIIVVESLLIVFVLLDSVVLDGLFM